MTTSRPTWPRLAATAALLAALLPASRAWAQAACPAPTGEDNGGTVERTLDWHGRQMTVRACVLPDKAGMTIAMEVLAPGRPPVRHQLPMNQGIEGELRSMRFDAARFALSTKGDGLTVPLRLASRNSGSLFYDTFDYLWLYQFDGSRVQRVFDRSVAETHDEKDAADSPGGAPTRARAIVIVEPGDGHHGLHDLRVRWKSWRIGPDDKPLGGEPTWEDLRYVFDGMQYQPQN